jgi:hypothetical protein
MQSNDQFKMVEGQCAFFSWDSNEEESKSPVSIHGSIRFGSG